MAREWAPDSWQNFEAKHLPRYESEAALAEATQALASHPPRPLREVNPEIPTWLAELIGRLLAKDPEERFAGAAEFRLELHPARWHHHRTGP